MATKNKWKDFQFGPWKGSGIKRQKIFHESMGADRRCRETSSVAIRL
jgi:hypothetical protein